MTEVLRDISSSIADLTSYVVYDAVFVDIGEHIGAYFVTFISCHFHSEHVRRRQVISAPTVTIGANHGTTVQPACHMAMIHC
jgi:hypothetical protein